MREGARASFESRADRIRRGGARTQLRHRHEVPRERFVQVVVVLGGGFLQGARVRREAIAVVRVEHGAREGSTELWASARKEWECLDCVARWCRPGFEPNYYPYLPAHVTRPKETRAVFVCQLPEKALFAVPKNSKLLAVPLFELYGNEARYGAIIASIPHLISRYHLNLEEKAE